MAYGEAASSSAKTTFACQYCSRQFKRHEHCQRHERTHTKEAPYKCPCGRAFPRRDLLKRHEKAAHDLDIKLRRKSTALDELTQQQHIFTARPQSEQLSDAIEPSYAFVGALPKQHGTALSRSTASPASIGINAQTGVPDLGVPYVSGQQIPRSTYTPSIPADDSTLPHGMAGTIQGSGSVHPNNISGRHTYASLDPFDLFGDGGPAFDNIDFSSFFLTPDATFDSFAHVDPLFPRDELPNEYLQDRQSSQESSAGTRGEPHSFSRLGSPLPSIGRDSHADPNAVSGARVSASSLGPPWKISPDAYRRIEVKIAALSHVLPTNFSLPSRHTLSRFLSGCFNGLYAHMPFVHVSSFVAEEIAPDLLLAMAAIGAQFRFEMNVGVVLFYAAKAVIVHQIHSRDDKHVIQAVAHPQNLSSATVSTTSPISIRDIPMKGYNAPGGEDFSRRGRLQTMQAILSLMVMGSWGPKELVGEAIAFQTLLAALARQDGMGPDDDVDTSTADMEQVWPRWIHIESLRRTKLFAYCFVNLQSVAYNVPPSLLTSEIGLSVPVSADEWSAGNARRWSEARKTSKIQTSSFAIAVNSMFRGSKDTTVTNPMSPIGNYALMFAIHQCIYFLRQGQVTLHPNHSTGSLRHDDIEDLSRALHTWQIRWESCPESTLEPQSPSGNVAFNSTALLRLAWIRLHSDLGPLRSFASREPELIVEAFKSCPKLQRHPSLTPAILHAAHALSVPVRLGIKFVAKTQTVTWSVQHSMCNLECAIFLSKWFEATATDSADQPVLTSYEKGLINLIRSIVLETGLFREDAFAQPGPAEGDAGWQRLVTHLGTAVATLWAEIFSGNHVFDLVSTIGTSLRLYSKQLECGHSPLYDCP